MASSNILVNKRFLTEPSQFKPENLLREARRQKNMSNCPVPAVCVLDPDGDIVDYLLKNKQASKNECWSCYHTTMYDFEYLGLNMGIIGCAVGASYAVLLAEQLFVSGCKLLISVTSAGIINRPTNEQTRFLLISEALRDEGTSYHYLPPSSKSMMDPLLLKKIAHLVKNPELKLEIGKSWTTDAPYRETAGAIAQAQAYGAIAVEMEAAALYAFATSATSGNHQVICFAHLTNTMARQGDDFEKGVENGSLDSLQLIVKTAQCFKGF